MASRIKVDRRWIARCLALAAVHRGRTAPNPMVGCVIVDARGAVFAEGAHAGPGEAHAEIAALRTLGGKPVPPGSTLYVNLEPCNHHGRTPPCAPVVAASGVARVVIGTLDPWRDHAGGARAIEAAGIAVTTGVLAAACEALNRPFFTHAREGRAHFTLKAAITLDGKIATVAGESKWITGDAARADVMQQRAWADAILVGAGTVVADDPRLSARGVSGGRDPVRIVLDTHARTSPTAAWMTGPARRILATGPDAEAGAFAAGGAEVLRLPTVDGRIDVRALATALAGLHVLVEGGGEVHAAMLAADLADEVLLYVAPKVVGGPAKSWVGGAGVGALADAARFAFAEPAVQLGADLRLHGVRDRRSPPG